MQIKIPIYVDLQKGKSYFAYVSIFSDSTNYKKNLPNNVLDYLNENEITVFHGKLKSLKVPIQISK